MTAPTLHTAGRVQWDTDAITAYLQRRYPRVLLWWSGLNASWMAMVLRPTSHPVGDELVEADTPAELEQRLAAAGVRPVPSMEALAGVPGAGGMTAGLWTPPAPARRPAPSRPTSPDSESEHAPARRTVRGRHEAERRPGLLRRLLERLIYNGEGWP